MKLGMLPTLVREAFGKSSFQREPEPDLVMDGEEEVRAFEEAGRIDGVMSASYLFNSLQISKTISGCQTVLDLGCGPATQLAQVAKLNPKINFTGIDLSDKMLTGAKRYCDDQGISNVFFKKCDMTNLRQFSNSSFDGVMSTLAIHHLPTLGRLKECLCEVKRVLTSDGALCLIDLSRLKNLFSILYFAHMNKGKQPAAFTLDYERSLRAAFSRQEFFELSETVFGNKMNVYSTAVIQVLMILKTSNRTIDEKVLSEVAKIRGSLNKEYQGIYNDLTSFFKWGGLKEGACSSTRKSSVSSNRKHAPLNI